MELAGYSFQYGTQEVQLSQDRSTQTSVEFVILSAVTMETSLQ